MCWWHCVRPAWASVTETIPQRHDQSGAESTQEFKQAGGGVKSGNPWMLGGHPGAWPPRHRPGEGRRRNQGPTATRSAPSRPLGLQRVGGAAVRGLKDVEPPQGPEGALQRPWCGSHTESTLYTATHTRPVGVGACQWGEPPTASPLEYGRAGAPTAAQARGSLSRLPGRQASAGGRSSRGTTTRRREQEWRVCVHACVCTHTPQTMHSQHTRNCEGATSGPGL